MIQVLLVVVPCVVLGVGVYAALRHWDMLPSDGASRAPLSGWPARSGTGFLDGALDWPLPQLARLPRAVLIGVIVALAVWVVAWLVLLVIGLGALRV